MPNKLILALIMILGVASVAAAINSPDGLFVVDEDGYHIAQSSAVVDLNARNNHEPKDLSGLVSDINTNFNVDVDTQSKENEPVDQTQVTANFTVNKGPVTFAYTHTRNYARVIATEDPTMAQANSEFDGTVNNRFTIGFNFAPDFGNSNSNTENKPSNNLANNSGDTKTAKVSSIRSSSID